MLLAETLKVLLTKKGSLKEGSEELEKILSAVGTTEITEDLSKQLSGLLTINEAKNDSTIKGHYYGQFADTYDRATEKAFEGFGLDKAAIEEIKASEKSSFKRIDLYEEKIKEVLKKKDSGGNSKKEIEQYQTEINELNKKIKAELQAKDDVISNLKKEFENTEIDWQVEALIPRDKLNNLIPEKFRLKNAKEAVNDFISKSGAKIVKKDGQLKLVRSSDGALDYTDSDLKTLIEKGLAEADLFQVGPGEVKKDPIEIQKNPEFANNNPLGNFQERINQSKKDFQKTV